MRAEMFLWAVIFCFGERSGSSKRKIPLNFKNLTHKGADQFHNRRLQAEASRGGGLSLSLKIIFIPFSSSPATWV